MDQYVITDGVRYVYRNYQNKYVAAPGEAMADTFTLRQANGICGSSLPKQLRRGFKVQKCSVPDDQARETKGETDKQNSTATSSDNVNIWVNKIASFHGLVQEALQRKRDLIDQLSTVDKELQDCLHYIEFNNLNAAQGYKAYKMVRERRLQRRSIKNELDVLTAFLSKNYGKTAAGEVQDVVEKINQRLYKPRVLTELFE